MHVIMFHSLGNEGSDWVYNYLSVPVYHFWNFCEYLAREKYDTLFLDEWNYLQDHRQEINDRQVVLTFDDGYLDNWVFLFPLLEKYGLRATIFINPEFVDPSQIQRPNLADAWDRGIDPGELQTSGFLNWSEIGEMDRSGHVDIQSHSMSHTWYFSGDTVTDIYDPSEGKYPWMLWNEFPEGKPFYVSGQTRGFIERGAPVFENGRSLGIRRYFPHADAGRFVIDIVRREGEKSGRQELLGNINEQIRRQGLSGRYESDEEMHRRYHYELKRSKDILEEKLNKKIEFLCWPGGAYNSESIDVSREVGYKASTLASRDSVGKDFTDYGGAYKRIRRYGINTWIKGHRNFYIDSYKKSLVHRFQEKNGRHWVKTFRRMRRLKYFIGDICSGTSLKGSEAYVGPQKSHGRYE